MLTILRPVPDHRDNDGDRAGISLRIRVRISVGLILVLALQACGGGGGNDGNVGAGNAGSGSNGSGSGGSGSGGSSTTPSLTASTRVVSATVGPTDATPNLEVHLSVANPPTSGLYYTTTFAATAVGSASVIWQPSLVNGAQSGNLEIVLDTPELMGSGTYHDTVMVHVCTDSKCVSEISGSPVSVAVTYVVTGNAVSDAGYAILPTSIALEAPSNGAAPTATANVTAYDVPPYGAYVFYASQSGGPVASMSFKQTSAGVEPYAYGTGTLTVNMKSPANLGPGVYNDVVTLSICYDATCTKPATGTPFKIPVTFTVTASAGREFQEQVINQNLTALAVDPTGQILYGTTAPVQTPGGTTPSQLIKINPTNAAITTLLSLPAAVSQIAVSQDSSYLYLLTQAWSTQQLTPAIEVLRVRTSDLSIDQTVPLTSIQTSTSQIAVSPLDPNTWSAAIQSQPDVWTVTIYDGQMARPNAWSVASNVVYGNQALWSSDASTLYILDANLNAAPISASGIGSGAQLQTGSAAQRGFDFGGNLQLAGGLIYSANGQVLDPTKNTIIGQYSLPAAIPYAALTIDTTNNRIFASYSVTVNDVAAGTIESYDLSGFTPTWIARLPVGTQPLRWGSNGLAWLGPGSAMGQQALYLISGTFVAP